MTRQPGQRQRDADQGQRRNAVEAVAQLQRVAEQGRRDHQRRAVRVDAAMPQRAQSPKRMPWASGSDEDQLMVLVCRRM